MKYADLSKQQLHKVNGLFERFQQEAKTLWFDSLPAEKQAEFTKLKKYERWELIDCRPTEDCEGVDCEVADPSGKRFRFVIEEDFADDRHLNDFYLYTVPKEITWYIKDAASNDQLEPVDEDEGDELGEEVTE